MVLVLDLFLFVSARQCLEELSSPSSSPLRQLLPGFVVAALTPERTSVASSAARAARERARDSAERAGVTSDPAGAGRTPRSQEYIGKGRFSALF